MSAPGDLTSLAACKQWLGVTSSTDDALIAGLVTSISQAILADLGRASVLPTIYTDIVDGAGEPALVLRNWPVGAVLSVTIDGSPLGPSATPWQGGWVLEPAAAAPPGAPQRLALRGRRLPMGRQNVAVIYRAGYEIDGEAALVPAAPPYAVAAAAPFGAWALDLGVGGATGYAAASGTYTFPPSAAGQPVSLTYGYVPNDLAQAACEWVADRYAARTRIGQSAKTLGGQETTSFIVKAMPDLVDRLLRPYRRVTA